MSALPGSQGFQTRWRVLALAYARWYRFRLGSLGLPRPGAARLDLPQTPRTIDSVKARDWYVAP